MNSSWFHNLANPLEPAISKQTGLLSRVLEVPSYGFEKDGQLVVPTHAQIFAEFFGRLNVFRSRKNWLGFFSWTMSLSLGIPLVVFLTQYLSFPLFVAAFVYGMVLMGSHGTFWFHRYGTHRAFKFRNSLVRLICRNLVIRTIPDEIYVVSHHVHHLISEKPGDPYNVHGGWLYCFLADVNHQAINTKLDERDYKALCSLMKPTGVRLNSYAQYQRWGSLCHPAWTIAHYLSNWAFWYGTFYLLGGHALACALFGGAGVWAIGVRTFNYEGHGKGKDRRRDGIDFNRADWSVNQMWPGFVAGEWHNNHHLYPNGIRSGFLKGQIDLPFYFIAGLKKLGLVHTCQDFKAEFLRDYYQPYLASKSASVIPPGTAGGAASESTGSPESTAISAFRSDAALPSEPHPST